MFTAELVLDVNSTSGNVGKALDDFSSYNELGQNTYCYLDKSYIEEFIENDFTGEENLLEGWNTILDELDKQNAEGFYLLHRG